MKTLFVRNVVCGAAVAALLTLPGPLYGDAKDDLNQALELAHQAWNPGGDPPSNDERTKLLTHALQLAEESPNHHVKGHRVKAILDMKAALEELKKGDPDQKAVEFMHDAVDELREATSIAD